MTAPVVVLVGPPGSGKSTVGRVLADRLGLAFRDTDADIEQLAGKPIPEIFVDEGEPHFRELEVRAVRAAAETHPGVLALGGGAVMAEATRELLHGLPVVFLRWRSPTRSSGSAWTRRARCWRSTPGPLAGADGRPPPPLPGGGDRRGRHPGPHPRAGRGRRTGSTGTEGIA